MEVSIVQQGSAHDAARCGRLGSLHRSLFARAPWAVLLLALASGCADAPDRPAEPESRTAPDGQRVAPADPSGLSSAPVVVFLGDSLTAGLGLGEEQAFPALVREELGARGSPIRVVNAGVSGDTSAGGLRRLDWLLRQDPDLLVVELGVNDALRGQPIDEIEANLRSIVARARDAGVPTLLLGLQIPPSYGREYAERFREIFPAISRDLEVPLVPFLLEGVAGDPSLNLPDGIHPTAAGHEIMADVVVDHLEPLVRATSSP